MKSLLNTKTFPEFCNQAFWGTWHLALINISALLLIALGFVKGGKYVGMLLGPSHLASDLVTACLVTIAILAIGLFDKHQSHEITDEQ